MKVKYKKLKKKKSVFDLMSKYGKSMVKYVIPVTIILVYFIGGLITAAITGTNLIDGLINFGLSICLLLLVIGIMFFVVGISRWAITYVRAFFRYAYLPLTIEEAKALGINESPVAFFKVLKSMMCYHPDYGETRIAIEDDETEEKLAHLFYQLFFWKDDKHKPLIVSWLNDAETRDKLKDAIEVTRIYKDYFAHKGKASLLKPLQGFYKLLTSEVIEEDETVIDAIAFETECNICVDKSIQYYKECKAIIHCKSNNGVNFFYLINKSGFTTLVSERKSEINESNDYDESMFYCESINELLNLWSESKCNGPFIPITR